ncbi:MAG: hypothetical protein B7Z80_13000, partial [Rhodospirillales bacterium 20-64-7]
EELVERARQITSDIAHDLRTPLTRLRGQLVLAIRQTHDENSGTAALPELLASALVQLDEVIAIFRALLRLAEIEAGAVKGSFVVFDLSALLLLVAEAYQPVAADRGSDLAVHIAPALTFQGDADLVKLMTINLLENAIRHCPAGTPIALRAWEAQAAIHIEVVDRGPGIPLAERERVFLRFTRLEAARQTSGFGLGLPLVKAVATLHRGDVRLLDNRPGLIAQVSLPALGSRALAAAAPVTMADP